LLGNEEGDGGMGQDHLKELDVIMEPAMKQAEKPAVALVGATLSPDIAELAVAKVEPPSRRFARRQVVCSGGGVLALNAGLSRDMWFAMW
jgi:hypothetical protein